MKKIMIGLMVTLVSVGAMAADPVISGVMVQQRWPWSRLVDIDYVLKCDQGQLVDITVEAYNGSDLLTLPGNSFSGDLYDVKGGARRIVWDPTKTAYANDGVLPEFRVKLTPSAAPEKLLYMVIDLSGGTSASRYPLSYYDSVEALPYGGLTNDIYRSSHLVMRKINNGTFNMGDGTCAVTLTKDFYIGVYQVTQAQWLQVMETNPSSFIGPFNPVNKVSYYDIRENPNNSAITPHWPQSSDVHADSFMGQLRSKTWLTDFDLPTDAQWEYACRAGTTGIYNVVDTDLGELGWYKENSGSKAHPVGEKIPNAWGLYDMHGNVYELCLDWYRPLAGGIDPKGGTSGSNCVRRGGSWPDLATFCRSAYRSAPVPTGRGNDCGFRLVRTISQ